LSVGLFDPMTAQYWGFRVLCMHLVKYKALKAPAPTYTHTVRLLEEGIDSDTGSLG
jgi:hypothetical protein